MLALRKKKIEAGAIRRIFGGMLNRMHYVEPLRDSRTMVERIQSWVYVAMERNATEVSRGTLRLYKPDGKKTNGYKSRRIDHSNLIAMKGVNRLATEQAVEIEDHPILVLFAEPNPLLDCCSLFWLVTAYLQIFGECFLYKGRGGRQVKELWPLPNQFVRPILGPENVIDLYEFRLGGGLERFPADDVVHIRKPSPIDMIAALGPLKGILQAAETNLRFAEWQNALFQNHGVPDMLLSLDDENASQDQIDAWIADWEASYGGWRRRGKAGVSPFKLKIDRLGLTMKEVRSEETLAAIKNEILSGFGVPPHVITTDGAAYTLRQGLQLWQRNTIGSYQVVIASALNRQLLPEWYAPDSNPVSPPAFLAFDNPVSEDKTTDTELRRTRIEGGLLSINEGRAEEGNDPVEGGEDARIASGMVRLTDPTAAELQQAQIDATAAQMQAQVDLQREQGVAAREDATVVRDGEAAAVEASAGEQPAPSFAELTSAAAQLGQIADLDAVNMVRDALAERLGTTLAPLTEIVAASSAAAVNDNVRENPAENGANDNEQDKPAEGEEEAAPGKKPKPAVEDGEENEENGKPRGKAGNPGNSGGGPRGRAGDSDQPTGHDSRGWDPTKPGEYPNRLLKRIVDLETKLELADVDQSPLTLEAALRRLFEGMEAEVRRNLPDAVPAE